MASGKSAFLEGKILNYYLGGATVYAAPGTLYVALSTAAWAPTATGSSMNEVAGGAYARVGVSNVAGSYSTATGSNPTVKNNAADIAFPTATAAWGNVQSVYLVDAASGGNILYGGDLQAARSPVSGDAPKFAAGQLTFSEF